MSANHAIENRLSTLRSAMAHAGIAACIIPSTDPHQSEYIADHWQARTYFSGFTGSAGTLVVTAEQAGLWTDSRYYLQAEQELPSGAIKLFRSQEPGVPTTTAWLGEVLPPGSYVGMNGWLLNHKDRDAKVAEFKALGMTLKLDVDPVAQAWPDRPFLPDAPVFSHPDELAGMQRAVKLAEIRAVMLQKGAQNHLICPLDDVAWTLNLRGSDVEYNPVFYAYLLVAHHACTLYADKSKFSERILRELETDGVRIAPYDQLLGDCAKLEGKTWIDAAATSCRIVDALSKDAEPMYADTLPGRFKAIKNEIELANLRKVMERDGIALLRLYMWLEENLPIGVSEWDVSEKLIECRKSMENYVGESFAAIAGYGENGAIVHYRPGEASAILQEEGIFLLDSGGQYLDGTTDITRTIALGTPTAEQKRNFTLVLQGHIALATAKFPEGVAGYQLDVLARMPLWSAGLNFGHGTGHGVGYFLSVHEGPQSIRHGYTERSAQAILPGMVTSNEPGYYESGQYGIRIENLILCKVLEQTAYGRFLGFETLTLFPIDHNLLDTSILTPKDVKWLNDYHTEVFKRLSPGLNEGERNWLEKRCRTI